MRRRLLLVAAALALALVAGSGAFSSVTAERGVQVAVAEDSNAYLQVTTDEREGTLTVTNQFGVPVDIDVREDHEAVAVETDDSEAVARCEAPASESRAVDITAEGSGIYVEMTREVPCHPSESAGNSDDRCRITGNPHVAAVSPIEERVDCDLTLDGGGDAELLVNATVDGDLTINGNATLEMGSNGKVTGDVTIRGGG